MFTQMVLDKRQEKVYIYDREDIDENYDYGKLQTIMEGGSSISSKLITESKLWTDFTNEYSSPFDNCNRHIESDWALENLKHNKRNTGVMNKPIHKEITFDNQLINLKKQMSQNDPSTYDINLYASKEKSLNSQDSDKTAHIELNNHYIKSNRYAEDSSSSDDGEVHSQYKLGKFIIFQTNAHYFANQTKYIINVSRLCTKKGKRDR